MNGTLVTRVALATGWGVALGAVLTAVGFASAQETQRMLRAENARLFLTFVGAVVVMLVVRAVTERRLALEKRAVHRTVVPGAVLFGAGWAVAGACPGAALSMLGNGLLAAVWLVAGCALGLVLGGRLPGAWFKPPPACGDD